MFPDFSQTLSKDRHFLQSAFKNPNKYGGLSKIEEKYRKSHEIFLKRLAALPKPEFDNTLPVHEKLEEIKKTVAENQVTIICGETGSGKTTQLPKICLELGRGAAGLIGHTQPRRLAARSVAERIAEELKSEIGSAGASMLDKLWLPALWGVAEVVLFCSLAKFRRKTHFSADILFAFLMLMIFVRSFDTKQEHGISPKPTYSRIKANYFSFGYFVGRVLPYQLFDLSKIPVFKQPAPSKIGQGSIQNIVLIMGESESAAHLKLFGYGRETSPFLTRLSQADFKPIVKQSYSAGFMTAVSLPSFFNVIPHANGLEQISGGDTNMFRLAKEQGYETYFYSAQAENQMAILNLIGKKWIDHLIQPTQLGYGNGDNMPDEKLLPLFDKINLQQGRHFIVLHQRGSHAPYGALLQPQDKVFGEADIADKYDNTIHKTDQMIQTVFEQLQKQPDGNWLFAYTSDHGQYVRQDIYNQGTVQPDSYIVPLVLYSPDKAVQQAANQAFAPCEIAFHQQLSTFLIHTLGYDMPVSGCREGSVTGNLITGDAGSLNIRNGKAEYVYPQ